MAGVSAWQGGQRTARRGVPRPQRSMQPHRARHLHHHQPALSLAAGQPRSVGVLDSHSRGSWRIPVLSCSLPHPPARPLAGATCTTCWWQTLMRLIMAIGRPSPCSSTPPGASSCTALPAWRCRALPSTWPAGPGRHHTSERACPAAKAARMRCPAPCRLDKNRDDMEKFAGEGGACLRSKPGPSHGFRHACPAAKPLNLLPTRPITATVRPCPLHSPCLPRLQITRAPSRACTL